MSPLTTPRRPVFRSIRLVGAALMLAAAGVLSACNLNISNQAEGRSEWKKEYTLAAGGRLEIKNTNGIIDVEPSDGNTVTITAERIARAGTDAEAKQAAEAMEIKEDVTGSSIVLDATVSHIGINIGGGSRQVKFHIRAPKGTILRLSNTNGNVDVRDMTGELALETTNGRIFGRSLAGATRAETTNGTIDLDYASLSSSGISAATTNGTVFITLPTTAQARVNARVTNGGIKTENLTLDTSEKTRRRLTATLNGGGPEVRIETTNGEVTLRGK